MRRVTVSGRALRTSAALASVGVLALGLAACSGGSDSPDADNADINIVASTAIWGSIAQRVIDDATDDGSDLDVTVTTILTGTDVDPHDYEATARDISAIRDADAVVGNGAGYDNWLTDNASDGAEVITAAPVTEGHDHSDEDHVSDDHATESDDHGSEDADVNPHVWFDLDLVDHFADDLAAFLHSRDDSFPEHATGVSEDITKAGDQLKALPTANVLLTEPVAGLLLNGTKLTDVTPDGFTHATLSESEPSAADLSAARDLITDGTVNILITNTQAETPAAQQLNDAARDKGLTDRNAVINVNETPDAGQDYFDYLGDVVNALEKATADL